MKEKVTIHDVAKCSGVSLATVSLALNNRPGVSAETRARVMEAASELGYLTRSAIPQPAYPHLKTIGMVVKVDPETSPQANPFYSNVLMGIEDACRRSGVNLLFASVAVDEYNRALETPAIFHSDLVDGLVVVGVYLDAATLATLGKTTPPLVLVDGYAAVDCYDAVVSDNEQAAHLAVTYLIARGHHHIGLVGGEPDSYPSLRDRRDGYERALSDHGIAERYVANVNINRGHGFQDTLALLSENPRITALFCINDDVGNAAIHAARELGKAVPGDLSIISFDDTRIAANAHPTLTTLHVDTTSMGRAAVHLLALRAESPDSARMTFTTHPWLVERESVSNCSENL